MEEKILLYDVLDDDGNILNSQVILENKIGFEIPKNYFFNRENTDLKSNILQIKNNNNYINISYIKSDEKDYKEKKQIIKEKYKIIEDFINYRGQKIIEFENENGINVMAYDGTIISFVNCQCKKYSDEYFDLYYILYSFDSESSGNYDNLYYQKNSYCIKRNGKYIYDKYNINLLKQNPTDYLSSFSTEMFCQYLKGKNDYDCEIDNYYVKKDKIYKSIVEKIENYRNDANDDISLMDIIEE